MDIRKVREELSRVKLYYQRNEILRALASTISAFKELGTTPPPSEVRGHIREAVQLLSRDPQIKETLRIPMVYNPGQEKQLYAQLILSYKDIMEKADREGRDEALARKIRIDKAYNEGLKHLAQGRVSEADAAFTEAVSNYKDEKRLFHLIGQALMEAGEVRRAYPYLKRGTEESPNMADTAELLEEAIRKREELATQKKD